MAAVQISDYRLWALLDASGFAVYRLRELELAPFHLTVEQASILRILQSARHGVTARTLCDLTLRQHNSISILAKRMLEAGLVTNVRKPGQRDGRLLIGEEGRHFLKKIPTTDLKEVFSVLGEQEKMQFARVMHSLKDRAGSLLLPEGPVFMRHLDRQETRTTQESETDILPSHYVLWSQLDSTRFAISRMRELELSQYGLSVEQASILRVLADFGQPVTTRDLEDVTLRQHHSISTLLERMARIGLVTRQKVPGERRYHLLVTQKGRRLLAGLTSVALEMTFSVLSESEKQQLFDSLRSLNRKAREMLGVSEHPI